MMIKSLFDEKLRIGNFVCSLRFIYQEWPQRRVEWGRVPRWKAFASRKRKKLSIGLGTKCEKKSTNRKFYIGLLK